MEAVVTLVKSVGSCVVEGTAAVVSSYVVESTALAEDATVAVMLSVTLLLAEGDTVVSLTGVVTVLVGADEL